MSSKVLKYISVFQFIVIVILVFFHNSENLIGTGQRGSNVIATSGINCLSEGSGLMSENPFRANKTVIEPPQNEALYELGDSTSRDWKSQPSLENNLVGPKSEQSDEQKLVGEPDTEKQEDMSVFDRIIQDSLDKREERDFQSFLTEHLSSSADNKQNYINRENSISDYFHIESNAKNIRLDSIDCRENSCQLNVISSDFGTAASTILNMSNKDWWEYKYLSSSDNNQSETGELYSVYILSK